MERCTKALYRKARELCDRKIVGSEEECDLAFVFGICLSLVANIGSAPMLSVLQVTVAACPPLVLLLAVELLNGKSDAQTVVGKLDKEYNGLK